jgi:hypothetical protein
VFARASSGLSVETADMSRRDYLIVAWHAVPGQRVNIDPPRRVRTEHFYAEPTNSPYTLTDGVNADRKERLKQTDHTAPTGRINRGAPPRHCVPGYDRAVPTGQQSCIAP